MMTNQEILQVAMAQSAVDLNCEAADFLSKENRVVLSCKNSGARNYLTLPFDCSLVSYGNNIVASVRPELAVLTEQYIGKYPVEHCFETPNLHVLNDALQSHGLRICFMAEYFLPDLAHLSPLPCAYEIRILEQQDIVGCYGVSWSNALSEKRRECNVLAVGAYDGGQLVGLAGCTADCDCMWQIGIDVLPQYRRQGLASSLTARLAMECLNRGKVPFYCAAWSNIKSVRSAIASGFRPAWVEMTAKSARMVEQCNQ